MWKQNAHGGTPSMPHDVAVWECTAAKAISRHRAMALARREPVRLDQQHNGPLGDRTDIRGRPCAPSRSRIGWWVPCGRSVDGERTQRVVRKRQVFDVPQPTPDVTEHHIGDIECRGCVQQGTYPPNGRASVPYGAGGHASVTTRSGDHPMPLAPICCLCADGSGYEAHGETVETALEEGDAVARPPEERIVEQVKRAATVHCDETGLRMGMGRNVAMVIHGRQCPVPSRMRARATRSSSPAQRGVGRERGSWRCSARWSGLSAHGARVAMGAGMRTVCERCMG